MKEIPLTQGKVAVVDNKDFEYLMLWKWCAAQQRNNYYAVRTDYCTGKGQPVRMNRVVYERMLGQLPLPGEHVIHLDGDSLNNCRDNLVADPKRAINLAL
jgi:HNH endonuclease